MTEPTVCPSCSTPWVAGRNFCASCGYSSLPPTPAKPRRTPIAARAPRGPSYAGTITALKVIAWLMIVLAILIPVGTFVVLMLGKQAGGGGGAGLGVLFLGSVAGGLGIAIGATLWFWLAGVLDTLVDIRDRPR